MCRCVLVQLCVQVRGGACAAVCACVHVQVRMQLCVQVCACVQLLECVRTLLALVKSVITALA